MEESGEEGTFHEVEEEELLDGESVATIEMGSSVRTSVGLTDRVDGGEAVRFCWEDRVGCMDSLG